MSGGDLEGILEAESREGSGRLRTDATPLFPFADQDRIWPHLNSTKRFSVFLSLPCTPKVNSGLLMLF